MSAPFGERYLVDPDLFPARIAGEPWGDDALVVDVAGGPYAFTDLTTGQARFLHERYAGFARPEGAPLPADAVVCRALRVAPTEFHRFDLRGVELTFDRTYEPHAVRLAGVDLMARIELGARCAAALWTSTGDPATFHGALENVFRVLVAYRALALGGVLLHSAGILPGGDTEGAGAVVCCGPSGTGKSTLSRLALAAGQAVASDDLNAVLPGGDSFELRPLPFAGDVRPAAWDVRARPLAALCRLRQGLDEGLEPLAPAAAAAALVACAPYVNADPHRADALLATVDRLLHSIPAHRLTFAREGGAARLLAALSGRRPSAR